MLLSECTQTFLALLVEFGLESAVRYEERLAQVMLHVSQLYHTNEDSEHSGQHRT